MKSDAPARKIPEPEQWSATFMVLDVSSSISSSQWRRLVAWGTSLLGWLRRASPRV
jgi:hypothetical protein